MLPPRRSLPLRRTLPALSPRVAAAHVAVAALLGVAACSAPTPAGPGGSDTAPTEAGPERVDNAPPDPTDAVFDVASVHNLGLTMAPEDWARLRDDPWGADWVHADFTCDGDTVVDVGVRPFGYGSRSAGKPPLKIAFDHWVPGQRWRELEQLKLDNSVQDASFLHERIGTEILRAFGVPAHRTGWADVSVNGGIVGFFVVLEAVDDQFLHRWFGNDDGILYGTVQGAWGHGLMPFTGDPLAYYNTQTNVVSDGSDLAEAARTIAGGSDDAFAAVIDQEGFLRQTLARSTFGAWDSFSADGNNYYLYNDGGTFRIIAWDLDYEFDTPGVANALLVDPRHPERTSPWGVDSLDGTPYVDPILARQIAAGVDVEGTLAALVAGPMEWNALDAKVVASAALTQAHLAADGDPFGGVAVYAAADLRLFLHARLSALAGVEVADCPAPAAGVLRMADLDPTGTVGWGEVWVDQTPYWGPGFVINGQHHCTGAMAHAPSDVTVTVPADCHTLTGAAGLQDWNQRCGDGVDFTVSQDGVPLWHHDPIGVYTDAVAFGPVAVHPGPLRFTTGVNAEYSCDTAAWVDVEVDCR